MSTAQTPAVRGGSANANGKAPARQEDSRIATVRNLLQKMEPEIKRALPRYMDANRMTRLALTAIRSDQKLLLCTADSLIAEVMKAAEIGLEINGILGHAYLAAYQNRKKGIHEAKLMVGYKGYLTLARNSRQIDTIQGQPVFEEDEFDFEYGSKEFLRHRPARRIDRGQLVGAWAMTWFKGASRPQFEFLDRPTIEARRKRSRQSDSGPWVTDYPAMCLKTAYRQHSKIWPLSPVARAVIETENLMEAGVELPESEPTELDAPVLEAPTTRSSQIADALEGRSLADDPDGDAPDDPEWSAGRE